MFIQFKSYLLNMDHVELVIPSTIQPTLRFYGPSLSSDNENQIAEVLFQDMGEMEVAYSLIINAICDGSPFLDLRRNIAP